MNKVAGGEQKQDRLVVVKVHKANLTRNFEVIGKMDPFAVVEWVPKSGSSFVVSKTHTDWNAHMTPVWDYTCRGQEYNGYGVGDAVVVTVYEDNILSRADVCGSAKILLDDLLGEGANTSEGTCRGPVRDLILFTKGESIGTVTVEASILLQMPGVVEGGGDLVLTRTERDLFEAPVYPLGVSGGTAPFYMLRRKGVPDNLADYYLGKDLSRASDEVTFYEEIRAIREISGAEGLGGLLSFTLEYAGIFSAPDALAPKEAPPKDLLVLRNLNYGMGKLRMLDLKIGQKTSQANWKGKSRMASLRQAIIDGLTNSYAEGYRLEGFDGRPPALATMDPLMDIGGGNAKTRKKAMRFMMQRMSGTEIFMHFLDVHQEPVDRGVDDLRQFYCPMEVAEIAMHEIVRRLSRLALECYKVPVPQKWIGSSIALGFDSGCVPSRSKTEAGVRASVVVNLFDWGRSELNTHSKSMELKKEKHSDRVKYWNYYVGGVARLSYEAARAYRHRFGCTNTNGWREIEFRILDFDSMSGADFLARVVVPCEPTRLCTVELKKGPKLSYSVPTLSYSIEWRPCPPGSRLQGTWRIFVGKASHLAMMDKMQFKTTSDPHCEVIAVSKDGDLCYRQSTSVLKGSLEPEWNETLEVAVAADPLALSLALEEGCSGLGAPGFENFLPSGVLEDGDPSAWCAPYPMENKVTIRSGSQQPRRLLDLWTERLKVAPAPSSDLSIPSPSTYSMPELLHEEPTGEIRRIFSGQTLSPKGISDVLRERSDLIASPFTDAKVKASLSSGSCCCARMPSKDIRMLPSNPASEEDLVQDNSTTSSCRWWCSTEAIKR